MVGGQFKKELGTTELESVRFLHDEHVERCGVVLEFQSQRANDLLYFIASQRARIVALFRF